MNENNNRFEREEIILKGSWPYFPLGKIAKILNVKETELSIFLGNSPEILAHAIIVTDIPEPSTQIYLNPIACHILIDLAPVEICGKRLKNISILLMKGISQKRNFFVKRLLKLSPPFLKAIYEWSDLGCPRIVTELFEAAGPEPVQ